MVSTSSSSSSSLLLSTTNSTTPSITIPVPLVATLSSSTTTTATTIPKQEEQRESSSTKRRTPQLTSSTSSSLFQQQQHLNSTTTPKKLWILRGGNKNKNNYNIIKTNGQQQQQQDLVLYEKEVEESESSFYPPATKSLAVTTTTTTTREEQEETIEDRFVRFQEQALESIKNIYEVDNLLRRVTNSGALTTSLPEDCIALLHTLVIVLSEGFLLDSISTCNTNVSSSPLSSSLSSLAATTISPPVVLPSNNNSNVVPLTKEYESKATTKIKNVAHVPPQSDDATTTRTNSNCYYYFLHGLIFVIKSIRNIHQHQRSIFVTNTIEDCCAAANDFFRLSELLETFYQTELVFKFPFLQYNSSGQSPHQPQHQQEQALLLYTLWNDYCTILLHDSVLAAEYCQHYVMVYIIRQTSLSSDLFSTAWESEWTMNEPITTLVTIIDNHFNLIEQYMCTNQYLYHKSIIATVKAIVCYYIRRLIIKADSVGRQERIRQRSMGLSLGINNDTNDVPFNSHHKTLLRMKDDISILSKYFKQRVQRDTDDMINTTSSSNTKQRNSNSALLRIISNEMSILETIHECLQTTLIDENNNNNVGTMDGCTESLSSSSSSLESFIVVLHKRTGANPMVTRFFMSDLWLLSNSQMNQRGIIRKTVDNLKNDLQLVTTNMMMISDQQQSTTTAGTRCNDQTRHVLSPLRQRPIRNTNDTMTALLVVVPKLDEMLRNLYEDRMAQGILPLCWTTCLPSTSSRGGVIIAANDDDEDDNSNDIDIVLARKIQNFTKQIIDFPRHIMELPQKHWEKQKNSHSSVKR